VTGATALDPIYKGSTVPGQFVGYNRERRTERMREERRLVWRVLRHWRGIASRGRVPRRDDIEPWLLGEDGRNCLLVAVQSPIELSHFLLVGVNLAVALCATDTLAGVLLSHVPRVVSTRRALMIEGSAMLRKEGILYRGILLPLSEDGVVIDQVLGATNYRSLREDEAPMRQVVFRTQWV
jgi:hypothetical protein